jgi:hypothetical protein
MTEQKRLTITDTRQIDLDYVSLDVAIERLTNAMKEGFTGVELEVERGYYDSHSAIFKVTKTREENDQEYDRRMQRQKSYQDHRRLEYERMKKEFGDA